MIFKSLCTAAIAFVVLVSAFWPAQTLAQSVPLKVAIVNVEAVRAQSEAYKKANAQFAKYSDEINAALQKEDQELRDANAELARKRSLLAPEAFAEERKKYEQRVEAFQRKVQERQKAMANVQADALGQINRKIVEIISKYAEDNNVTLVLPESVTVLSARSLNINDYVLQNLNKALPSIEVQAPVQ